MILLRMGSIIYPGATVDSEKTHLAGGDYANATRSELTIYNSSVDLQQYGKCAGLLRRSTSGSEYYTGISCGSRSISGALCSSYMYSALSTRGCKERNNDILGRLYKNQKRMRMVW